MSFFHQITTMLSAIVDRTFEVWWYFFPAMVINLVLYFTAMVFRQESILPIDRQRIGEGRGLLGVIWALLTAGFCSWAQARGIEETLGLTLGAALGMIVLSLVKRRLGIPRGFPFRPWEHLDFVLGAILLQSFGEGLSCGLALQGVIVCGLTHWSVGGVIKSVFGER